MHAYDFENHINFLLLGVGYFLSEKGKLCTDNGNNPVDDMETCKTAISELNGIFEGLENYANWKYL